MGELCMLLEGKNLSFGYEKDTLLFENVNISITSNQRVGLVARSGFGKTTLSKILAGYEEPLKGQVFVDQKALDDYSYCPVQLIHQHPEKSVNPKWKMKDILQEGEIIERRIVEQVGIRDEWMERFPHELSGGELQRFCIARALGKETKFLIADEITTMLDPITQADLWHFMIEETKKREIGMLVVTHNASLLERVCTSIIDFEQM